MFVEGKSDSYHPPPSVDFWIMIKMVSINTDKRNIFSSPTKTSVFIKFLIKVCFLPVRLEKNEQRVVFRLISKRSIAYVVIYMGLGILAFMSGYLILDPDAFSKISNENVVETYAMFSNHILYMAFIFPLFLAKSLSMIKIKMVWNEQLPFPKHGVKTIISYFGSLAGTLTALLGFLLQMDLPPLSVVKVFVLTSTGKLFILLSFTFLQDLF